MKIGIDISQVIHEGTGVARFTNGLINGLLGADDGNTYMFFFSSLRRIVPRELKERIESKGHAIRSFFLPPTLLSLLWNEWHRVSIENFLGPMDWFISSDWTEPPSKKTKKATIVHDLVFKRYPESLPKNNIRDILRTQTYRLEWVKKESTLIFADSQATKNDLMSYYQIDDKRIVVNYPGVEVEKPTKEEVESTLKKYKLTQNKFILTVGKLEPRKNIDKLIEAFQKWNNPPAGGSIDLVVVGAKGWGSHPNKHTDQVKFLGYINDKELSSLYTSALFFIYPSIWEGFGYPIVEAMKLGCPVATSNTSSLAELGENASLLFDPHSTESILTAIKKLTTDEKLRQELIKKGLKKSEEYSWKKYVVKIIRELEARS